jgi:hypothetical protein
MHVEQQTREELEDAEWQVRKPTLLLDRHREAARRQRDWRLKEARLQRALTVALARLHGFGMEA